MHDSTIALVKTSSMKHGALDKSILMEKQDVNNLAALRIDVQ